MATQFHIKCERKRDEKVKKGEKSNFGSTKASKKERKKEKWKPDFRDGRLYVKIIEFLGN